jgi:membrane protein DedA with SNARE-associated domain
MSPQDITHLIIQYRYWVLIPFAIIEGPIVAFIAGTLASLGYFNLIVLLILFFARDMIMDAFWYFLGYFGWQTAFAKRMLHKMNVRESHLDEVRVLWDEHPARTMFIGKLSYGIAAAFIVVAGMIKFSLREFFSYGALIAILQYFTLILLGYFFGNAFGGTLAGVVDNIQYAIVGAATILSAYYLLRWYIRKKFSSEQDKSDAGI